VNASLAARQSGTHSDLEQALFVAAVITLPLGATSLAPLLGAGQRAKINHQI
jgi:hypothetical protein